MLHIIARIKLLKTEEGGRTSWVRSGYHPNIRFGDLHTDGALTFLDHQQVYHYRNHGTDYGRVLIGIQVPPQDQAAFQEFLDRRGYVYCDESHNAAYRLFLS